MPIPRPEPQSARVIAHVDMDCFYVQVEQRKQPELRGLPTAVVQYNSWKGGGLIAVSYEARKFGVKRSMRGDEAKKVCPDIQLIQVPVARGKADLNLYRDAGSEVVSVLSTNGRCERASIDEVYLDLTDAAEAMMLETPPEMLEKIEDEALKSNVLGLADDGEEREEKVRGWLCRNDAVHDKMLACGAIIVAQLRQRVLEVTQFTCSAGIAHNKMLAKLASAMHKPAQQTIVPASSVKDLLASLPVKKMKQLGGKLGSSLQSELGITMVGDLLQFSVEKLQERYGTNTGSWLWNIARGISGEEVEGRLLPKSHGCGKTFRGPQALKSIVSVEHWLNQLCEELSERIQSDLEQNKRVARTLTLHASVFKSNDIEPERKFPSKSCQLRYGTAKLQEDAKKLFDSGLREFVGPQNNGWGLTALSVSASKILDIPSASVTKFATEAMWRIHQEFGTCPPPVYCTKPELMAFWQRTGAKLWWCLLVLGAVTFAKLCHAHEYSFHVESGEACEDLNWLRFFQEKDHSAPSNRLDASEHDSLLFSPSESKSRPIQFDDVRQKKPACNEICNVEDTSQQNAVTIRTGTLERKSKSKEPCSILRYFRCDHSSSTKQAFDGFNHMDTTLSTPDSEGHSNLDKVEHHQAGIFLDGYNNSSDIMDQNQSMRRSDAWAINVEDIDPSVIDELPPDIQRELRSWLPPPKRAKKAKQGPDIAQYFLPANNS